MEHCHHLQRHGIPQPSGSDQLPVAEWELVDGSLWRAAFPLGQTEISEIRAYSAQNLPKKQSDAEWVRSGLLPSTGAEIDRVHGLLDRLSERAGCSDGLGLSPLPTAVAHLISDALDREVSVAQLWPGRARPAEFWVPANHGLQLPWTTAGTVEVLDDWLRHIGGSIGMDRRVFLAVSGASLTAPAWGYVDHLGIRGDSFAALASDRRSITVTSAMVDAVAAGTAGIRTLGDGEGGNEDNLRFLHHHLLWVTKLLRQGRFTSSAVADRLLTEWAQLAQLGGVDGA